MKNTSISNPRTLGKQLTAMEKIGLQKTLDAKFERDLKDGLIDNLGRKINSKNLLEKSRNVLIYGKEYTRTVSEIFATDKDFKNSINIDGKNSSEFKEGLKKIGTENLKYILGQDIIDSDSEKNLKLNWKIIQAIVSEQYNGNWFEFTKASGLVKLDGNKISKSELTSCCNSYGNWLPGGLGNYGYIWLRALVSNSSPMYIKFKGDSANGNGNCSKTAMRIASQK